MGVLCHLKPIAIMNELNEFYFYVLSLGQQASLAHKTESQIVLSRTEKETYPSTIIVNNTADWICI